MWPRFISIVVGIWLAASADVFGIDAAAKANIVICGALAATFAIVAIWEVTRGLRWINFTIGIWLLASLLIFGYEGRVLVSILISGVLLITFSLMKGGVTQQTGGGWSALWGRR
jgi:hypothetical protein